MRIAIAGTGRLGLSLLGPLLASEHEVVALVQDGRRVSRLSKWWAPLFSPMAARARLLRLPIVWIDKMSAQELAPLRELAPDILLVGGFGVILKRDILDLPRIGCVNVHSSLLPKHRGPNPFCAVILAGDSESGITFHVMDEGIDTGDIIDQTRFPLFPDDDVFSVYDRACVTAAMRVVPVMDRIASEGLSGSPQDHAAATYDKKLTEADTWIRWDQPAAMIEARVRALPPMFVARFRCRSVTVYVLRASYDSTPVDALPGTILSNGRIPAVATGRGTLFLFRAYTRRPVPYFWPAPWNRPRIGEQLPMSGISATISDKLGRPAPP